MKQVNATLSYMQLLELFKWREKNNKQRIFPGALKLVNDGNNEYLSAC